MDHPVIAAAREAGIVGQGGAGFPLHVKLAAPVDTVIANGCECEPLLATDADIMERHAGLLLEGLDAAMAATGAGQGIIAIKRKHASLVRVLSSLITDPRHSLLLLDNFYPAGDEQVLIFEATGRTVPPLSLPRAVGCLVSNVGTLVSLAESLKGRPVTLRTVTVTGEVARPAVFTVPIGASVKECIEFCGGATLKDWVLVLGGPVMGTVLDDPADIAAAVVSKTLGGIIVAPRGHYLHRKALQSVESMRRRAATACIQCRFCTDLCPRRLIGQPFETHRVMRAFGHSNELDVQAGRQALLCCFCGVCEHVACPMDLSPCAINRAVRQELGARGLGFEGSTVLELEITQWKDYRKVPMSRLAARIGITGYMDIHPEPVTGFMPEVVDIPLRQHIGKAAVPLCKVGGSVAAGELIGEIPEGALGARVHASVSGTVESVGDSIRIRRQG